MSSAQSSTAAFADASENQREQLPKLPPGKKYGPRIGGWGPYSIVDDVPAAPDLPVERGPLHEISQATKGVTP